MTNKWIYDKNVGMAGGWYSNISTPSGLVRAEVSDHETSWVWSYDEDKEMGFCDTKGEAMREVEKVLIKALFNISKQNETR